MILKRLVSIRRRERPMGTRHFHRVTATPGRKSTDALYDGGGAPCKQPGQCACPATMGELNCPAGPTDFSGSNACV